MVPPKKIQPSVLYNSSALFSDFSTLIRAPLPSWIARTAGTLFYRYISPSVHFWGLLFFYFGVGGWSYGQWPCVQPCIGGIISYFLYSFGWSGLIANWCQLQYGINTTQQPQLSCWNACVSHESRGPEQVWSSCLVWHCGGVGLLLLVDRNWQWVVVQTSYGWVARFNLWLCLYQNDSCYCGVALSGLFGVWL